MQLAVGQVENIRNVILPFAAMCGIVVALPALLLPHGGTSQRRLAAAILLTGGVTWVAGALILALLHAALNGGLGEGSALDLARNFLARATPFALLWAPLLALVWLIRAQEMNRRVGLAMRDPDRGGGSDV